jgi:hypothetical protein
MPDYHHILALPLMFIEYVLQSELIRKWLGTILGPTVTAIGF